MVSNKERLEKLEAGVKEIQKLNEQLKQLDKQKTRIKEKEMELLNLQIKNKEKEIHQLRQARVPRYKGHLIPQGYKPKNARGETIEKVD